MNRVFVSADDAESAYHCMSRCVQGRALLDEEAREVFRRMIWKVAEFCGIEVITYAVMPNHFHVLIRVPIRTPISDEELLRRYQLLHPRPNSYQTARIEVIADWLKNDSVQGVAWRAQQLALMNDLSAYMRLLKQRFSIWFNQNRDLFGTLWAERFKSVLVQYDRHTLLTMATYIDLNAVRKGIVEDPKDYRFCGYAEAVAGGAKARAGISIVCPAPNWKRSHSEYRLLLYAIGAVPRLKGEVISEEAYRKILSENGTLSPAECLRCRWRYLTYAIVLGSPEFVEEQRRRLLKQNKTTLSDLPPLPPSKPLPSSPWGPWAMLSRVRPDSNPPPPPPDGKNSPAG